MEWIRRTKIRRFIMIICSTDTGIYLKWREEQKPIEKKISFNKFQPYFYIKTTDISSVPKSVYIRDRHGSLNAKLFYENVEKTSLEKELLTKVTWKPSRPEYSRKISKIFVNKNIDTYEADVAMQLMKLQR